MFFFFFNDTATTEIYTLSLHDALPILQQIRDGKDEANQFAAALGQQHEFGPQVRPNRRVLGKEVVFTDRCVKKVDLGGRRIIRSEEHTSELQSHSDIVCRLLLEKKKDN